MMTSEMIDGMRMLMPFLWAMVPMMSARGICMRHGVMAAG